LFQKRLAHFDRVQIFGFVAASAAHAKKAEPGPGGPSVTLCQDPRGQASGVVATLLKSANAMPEFPDRRAAEIAASAFGRVGRGRSPIKGNFYNHRNKLKRFSNNIEEQHP
jgi:hypothetical protein